MSRLIDADKLYDYISDVFTQFGHDVMSVKDALKAVETAPTVNAVELPCKVGDTVYDISWNGKIRNCKILMIYQNMYYVWKIRISPSIGGEYAVVVDAIGKTVFLTREEAEQALRERELKWNGGTIMFELNKEQTRAFMPINDFANICGFFYNAMFDGSCKACPNNGYNCKHPECSEAKDGIGCCFAWGCPLGWEADEEDCKEFGFDYEEGEFIVTENPTILKKIVALRGEQQ